MLYYVVIDADLNGGLLGFHYRTDSAAGQFVVAEQANRIAIRKLARYYSKKLPDQVKVLLVPGDFIGEQRLLPELPQDPPFQSWRSAFDNKLSWWYGFLTAYGLDFTVADRRSDLADFARVWKARYGVTFTKQKFRDVRDAHREIKCSGLGGGQLKLDPCWMTAHTLAYVLQQRN